MSGENTGSIGKAKRLDGIDSRSIIKIKTERAFPAPGTYYNSHQHDVGSGPSIGPVKTGS